MPFLMIASKSIEETCQNAHEFDMILLVLDIEDGLKQVGEWTKEISKTRRPMYVILNKSDVSFEEKFAEPLELQEYDLYFGLSRISAKTLELAPEFISKVCNLFFIEPISIIYDFETKKLTHDAEIALKRIFWILDEDHDGMLNKSECKQVSHVTFGTNLVEFLELHKRLIQEHKYGIVWKQFRAYNYDAELGLDFTEEIDSIAKCEKEDFLILSDEGISKLQSMFLSFDLDKDSMLNDEEFKFAFQIGQFSPFLSQDYIFEKKNGKVTMNGWVSLMSALLLHQPKNFFECLCRWDVPVKSCDKLVVKRKKNLYRGKKDPLPNIFSVLVFGAPKCGKSSLIAGEVSKVYSETKRPLSAVKSQKVERQKVQIVYTEPPQTSVKELLEDPNGLENYDFILMVFDGNEKYSFKFVENIQMNLLKTTNVKLLPCLYIQTKGDLPQQEQFVEDGVYMEDFLSALNLVQPEVCTVKQHPEELSSIYEVIAKACVDTYAAEDLTPNMEKKKAKVSPFTILRRSVTVLGILGVVGWGCHWMWNKYIKGESKK